MDGKIYSNQVRRKQVLTWKTDPTTETHDMDKSLCLENVACGSMFSHNKFNLIKIKKT